MSRLWSGSGGLQVTHRHLVQQWQLLGAVLLVVAGLLGFIQFRQYLETEKEEVSRLRTQVMVADQLLTSQIGAVDAALRTLLNGLDRWRMPGGYEPFAMAHLKRVEQMMPGVRTFVVLNAQGDCQLSNHPELVGSNLARRSYFQRPAQERNGQKLYIAPPYRTLLGAWAVTVSRPILDAQGAFQGVVAATLSPDYFQELMTTLSYSADMRVSLIHDQGSLYVTAPRDALWEATDFSHPQAVVARHLGSDQLESYFESPGIDTTGQPGFVMLRSIKLQGLHADHGFVAVASRTSRAVFSLWRTETLMLTLVFASLVAVGAGGLGVYQRRGARLRSKALAAEAALTESHARYQHLAQTIPCVLFDYEVSAQGKPLLRYISPYSQHLLGHAPDVLRSNPQVFLGMLHPDDRPSFLATQREAFKHKTGYDCAQRIVLPGGGVRWIQMIAVPSPLPTQPDVTLWSGFIFDITERKQLEDELLVMAYNDPLTNTHNRRSFMMALSTEIQRARRTGTQAALLMIDIDHFKHVNDTWGHNVGDEVLKHLVTVLQGGLRSIDTLGRLGGEEFAVLLPATTREGALDLAERLRASVETHPVHVESAPTQAIAFTISLGVAFVTADTISESEVLKLADNAMYQAKNAGRNRVCVV